MATSGTAVFNPDFGEIIEEAYERAGLESKTGYDIRTARRSLNLLSIEFSNRGLNLFTVQEQTLALTTGTASYALPLDTIDILDAAIRRNDGNITTQSDIAIPRIPESTYLAIPNKLQRGMPVQYMVARTSTPTVTFWLVPDRAYTLAYYRIRRIQDAGSNIDFTADVASRFLEPLIAGLALRIAEKRPEVSPDRVGWLKSRYEEQFELATQEDRERAVLRIVPGGYRY